MNWKNLKAPNLGLLVYKKLYTEQNILAHFKTDNKNGIYIQESIDDPTNRNKKITVPFADYYSAIYETNLLSYSQIENEGATHKFLLYTTYPGLLSGSGYTHDSNAEQDIKIGFYFDHSSGQPVIPGSSIKGVIRSIFENKNNKTDESSLAAFRFIIKEIIEKDHNIDKNEWTDILSHFDENKPHSIAKLNAFKESVFGTQESEGNDIFYDAVIHIAETKRIKSNEKQNHIQFIGDDFITPHHKSNLKNPTPIMFLKVLPNIAFEFRFSLSDFCDDAGYKITAAQKCRIFKEIILTLGVGAKTNVGYGHFNTSPHKETQPISTPIDKQEKQKQEKPKAESEPPRKHNIIHHSDKKNIEQIPFLDEKPEWEEASKKKIRDEIDAYVLSHNNGTIEVQLCVKGIKREVKKLGYKAEPGTYIKVIIKNILGSAQKGTLDFDVSIKK